MIGMDSKKSGVLVSCTMLMNRQEKLMAILLGL